MGDKLSQTFLTEFWALICIIKKAIGSHVRVSANSVDVKRVFCVLPGCDSFCAAALCCVILCVAVVAEAAADG